MAEVRHVAEYFISLSEESTPLAITPLKLQKLLYYSQAYHLRDHRVPLFHEAIYAWEHGPVVPQIYRKYKNFGYLTIPHTDFEYADLITNEQKLNDDEIATINEVWEQLGHLDGKTLEELTHQEDPWLFTEINDVIDRGLIEHYFNQLAYQF